MFEDETVDIACPNCSRKNSILVREFEASSEARITCQHCGAIVKVEADEFRRRLRWCARNWRKFSLKPVARARAADRARMTFRSDLGG